MWAVTGTTTVIKEEKNKQKINNCKYANVKNAIDDIYTDNIQKLKSVNEKFNNFLNAHVP